MPAIPAPPDAPGTMGLTESAAFAASADFMPAFDFERRIDRGDGDSLKWSRYAGRDVLPLWVADMDFAAPPPVLDALRRRIDHGVLGYAKPWPSLVEATIAHLYRQYGWQIDPDWLVWLPGVVPGLSLACRALEGKASDVITAAPIYPPFLSAPGSSGRALTVAGLHLDGGTDRGRGGYWRWDWAALEAVVTPTTRLLLLCHPHNPVGRAWNAEELAKLADFCQRHDLYVCSDEIHCDLILDTDKRHTPLALAHPALASRCMTLMAPSKTYNIPGLGCSFAVISDAALRSRFAAAMRGIVPDINVLGLVAAEAAYREGEPWRRALLDVLRARRDRVEQAIAGMPGLSTTHVEATYLAWIDARGLNVPDPAGFFEQAGVGLSNGADFGAPGWVRLNFACTSDTLETALGRMRRACVQALGQAADGAGHANE